MSAHELALQKALIAHLKADAAVQALLGEPARIRVWMNDRLLTDFQHTEKTTQGVPASGGIALQVHPDVPNNTVWKAGQSVAYRNIRIKELR